LYAREIAERSLSAQMATLCACETMQGAKQEGEGMMGLAWAFRAAGCPSVIASQWSIDEKASASLMRSFYDHLLKEERKDNALQAAMKDVMNEPGYEAPYYWAAFQVIGKTDALFPKRN